MFFLEQKARKWNYGVKGKERIILHLNPYAQSNGSRMHQDGDLRSENFLYKVIEFLDIIIFFS